MDLFKDLNEQQQQAVAAGLGPVLVMAGPGAGKTRVLTRRIAYIISQLGVRPYNVMAVTFTNRAAREMERRVTEMIGSELKGMWLGTFHAVCARLLRREAQYLPVNNNFVIFDADDQVALVKQALADLNIDEKKFRPAGIHAAISAAKNELVTAEKFPTKLYREQITQKVYLHYQQLLVQNNAVDFDDLLMYTAFLLEQQPVVREQYALRFEHILVDEFQDTNIAQYQMLKNLASFHRNLYVVGDADQSIYRWRGADYRNVTRFQDDYPDSQLILLEQNYRSSQSILDVAMAVIDHSPDARRIRKQLYTVRGEGFKVNLYEAMDDRVEAAYVVETIAAQVRTQHADPGDFAVMYRTNAQSRLLEEAFLNAGLPYKLVGAQKFYGRREIKDLIAYLRLVHNPEDEVSLTRIINVPARGVGAKTLLALRMQAQRLECQPGQLLLMMAQDPNLVPAEALGGRVRGALVNFGALLGQWIAARDSLAPMSLMDRIIEDTGYQNFINDGSEEGRDRWENVMELRRLAAEFHDEGLQAFLERVALVADQDTLDSNTANVPTLLTLHAAKGLEFPHVFITGVNDGVLPHSRSKEDPEQMLEERRLFYVGITRAQDRLHLIFTQKRSAYGYDEPALPSPFLDDIPLNLLEEAHTTHPRSRQGGRSVYAGGREKYERWETPAPRFGGAAPAAPTPQYAPGMRVQHAEWGEGIVLNSRMDSGEELLDIHFAEVGLKRVMASLARLEIKP